MPSLWAPAEKICEPFQKKREMWSDLPFVERRQARSTTLQCRCFGGAGVLEIRVDDDGDTFRTVYTVTLPDAVYVLHAFQKKSAKGIATPQRDLELIRKRLKEAQEISQKRRRESKEVR